MTTCAARFAFIRFFRAALARSFRAAARPNDDEFELTNQEGYENREEKGQQCPDTGLGSRPGTRPGRHHVDLPSYSLSERGVGPGDIRMLSKIVNRATSSDSVEWNSFLESSIVL